MRNWGAQSYPPLIGAVVFSISDTGLIAKRKKPRTGSSEGVRIELDRLIVILDGTVVLNLSLDVNATIGKELAKDNGSKRPESVAPVHQQQLHFALLQTVSAHLPHIAAVIRQWQRAKLDDVGSGQLV